MAAREGERAAVDLRLGDCLDVLRTMADASVDAIVTDPPSGISFMSAKWDSDKGGRDQWVAWLAAIMREAKRVIRPGGHALIWALPRTSHWTATAVEDAGWAVRDICHHINGQAFPKSLNLGEGRGSGLKPSTEHYILARAPLSERTIAANVQRWGTGGINIDASRIPGTKPDTTRGAGGQHGRLHPLEAQGRIVDDGMGRWPSNLVLSCCGDDPHREGCPVAMLDAQSGMSRSSDHIRHRTGRNGYDGGWGALPVAGTADAGGASRFFQVFTPDCWLCGGLRHGTMSVTQVVTGDVPCRNVASAASHTSQGTKDSDSVPPHAPQPQPQDSVANSPSGSTSAPSAGRLSPPTLGTGASTVPQIAQSWHAEQIAPLVRSVASLCEPCATAIARVLVALRHNPNQASTPLAGYMPEHKKQTLFQSLALYAESLGSTGTTPTIASLKLWYGYARHAIENTTAAPDSSPSPRAFTSPEKDPLFSPAERSSFRYQAKPSRAERDRGLEHLPRTSAADMVDRTEGSAGMQSPRAGAGRTGGGHNHHPTVKPIALMKHLVGLITPPGGTVLDMFCGSGTTGCACAALGFDFIGIEQDQSYIDIAALRIQAATPTQPALQEAI